MIIINNISMDYLKIDENIIKNSFTKNDLKLLMSYIDSNEIIKYNLEEIFYYNEFKVYYSFNDKINILLCDNVFKKFNFMLYFFKHNIISLDIIYTIIIYNLLYNVITKHNIKFVDEYVDNINKLLPQINNVKNVYFDKPVYINIIDILDNYLYSKNLSEVIENINKSKSSIKYKKVINEFEGYLIFKHNQRKLFCKDYKDSYLTNNVLYIMFYILCVNVYNKQDLILYGKFINKHIDNPIIRKNIVYQIMLIDENHYHKLNNFKSLNEIIDFNKFKNIITIGDKSFECSIIHNIIMNSDKFIEVDDKGIINVNGILLISALLDNFKYFYNFDVNECDNELKITPLFCAVYKQDIDCINYLINSGADINFLNKNKENILDFAIKYNCVESIKYLKDNMIIKNNKLIKKF